MTLTLAEWRTSRPLELSAEERQALESCFDAQIKTSALAGHVTVTPGSVVGTISVGERVIVVSPKIAIDRVLFMTAYAADPFGWQETWSAVAGVHDLIDGMAALFARACEDTLSRGLLRAYHRVNDDARAVRGRIRWERQARRVAPLPIAVSHSVHDDDILENQLIRSALAIVRRGASKDMGSLVAIDRLWRQMKHLTPLADPVTSLARLTWSRQNQHYRPLLELARTILTNSFLDVRPGHVPVTGFTLRLYDVFEQFVRVALREAAGLSDSEFPTSKTGGLFLAEGGAVSLYPDLGVRSGDAWRFVGDVKYKVDSGPGHDSDLYQLLAYATATRLENATLIYADGPRTAQLHTVRGTGTRLHITHLDLEQHPFAVLNQLRAIANEVLPQPVQPVQP